MGRKPKTETTAATIAVELTDRQIKRQKSRRFAELIETVTDNDGFIAIGRQIGVQIEYLYVHLSDFSATLLSSVVKIKAAKKEDEERSRERLAEMLSTDQGRAIAHSLLSEMVAEGQGDPA